VVLGWGHGGVGLDQTVQVRGEHSGRARLLDEPA